MKRGRVILIIAVMLVVAVGVGVLFFHQEPEPSYQGRSLTTWLKDMRFASSPAQGQAALVALNAIGTNAIPYFLKWQDVKDPRSKEIFISWVKLIPGLRLRVWTSRDRATTAYSEIFSLGKTGWPYYIQMVNSNDATERRKGLKWLSLTGADKQTLLPVLLPIVNDPNDSLRHTAAWTLHYNFPNEAEAAGVYQLYPELKSEPVRHPEANAKFKAGTDTNQAAGK